MVGLNVVEVELGWKGTSCAHRAILDGMVLLGQVRGSSSCVSSPWLVRVESLLFQSGTGGRNGSRFGSE